MIWNLNPVKEYEDLVIEASRAFGVPEAYIRKARCRKYSADAIRGCISNILYNVVKCEDASAVANVMGHHRAAIHFHLNEHSGRMKHWPQYKGSYDHLEKYISGGIETV